MTSRDNEQRPFRDTHQQANKLQKEEKAGMAVQLPSNVRKRLRIGRAPSLTGMSVQELLATLKDSNWSVRVAAVQALGELGEQVPVERVAAALLDEHESVRATAARALGKQRLRAPIEPLLAALEDSSWLVRTTALQALSKCEQVVPVAPLLTALRDEDESVRAAAAGALGTQEERTPVGPLVQALHDSAWHVREMALNSLGPRLPAHELYAALRDEDVSVRRAALTLQMTYPDVLGPLATTEPPVAPSPSFAARNGQHGQHFASEQDAQEEQVASHVQQQAQARYLRQGRMRLLRHVLLYGWYFVITYFCCCTWMLYQGANDPLSVLAPASPFGVMLPAWLRASLAVLCLLLLVGCVWATGDHWYEHWKIRGKRVEDVIEEPEQVGVYRSVQGLNSGYDTSLDARGASRRAAMAGLAAVVISLNGIAWFSLARGKKLTTSSAAVNAPGKLLATYNAAEGPILALSWSPDSAQLALAGWGVHLWTPDTGRRQRVDLGEYTPTNALAWSPDGANVASGGGGTMIEVWNPVTSKIVSTYVGQTAGIHSIAWSPNGKYILSSSGDGTVSVWYTSTGETLHFYQGYSGSIASVAWSPDGRYIAAAGQDNLIWVRDVLSNTIVYKRVAFHYSDYLCPCTLYGRGLAWAPDARRLAFGDPDGIVSICDIRRQTTLLSYRGHRAAINDLSWSPDGSYIASASDDRTVRVWEAATGRTVLVYKGHSGIVTDVKWSPDGTRIASASPDDHTAQVWLAL